MNGSTKKHSSTILPGKILLFARGSQKYSHQTPIQNHASPKKVRRSSEQINTIQRPLGKSNVLSRSVTKKPRPKKSKPQLSSRAVWNTLALLLLLVGSSVAYLGFHTNKQVIAQIKQPKSATAVLSKETSPEVPEEVKPSPQAVGSYKVDPTAPASIRISKIGVYAMITPQGVDASGALRAPNNIHNAGWYSSSARPSASSGAMLLDGHVSGPTQRGVFYAIKKLGAGDKIIVTQGDGTEFSYSVVRSQTYPANAVDMDSAVVSVDKAKAGLNLITCTGTISGTHYNDRIIVYAVKD